MKKNLQWLKEFSETCGVSGFEGRMKALTVKRLTGLCDVSYDRLGSVVSTKKGPAAPCIMLAIHMDEIGFLVKHFTKEGFLKFTCLGGWWEQVMLSQRVTVHGSKGDLVGVIGSKTPHVLSPEERKKVVQKKDMYIDIVAESAKAARELGVFEGCPATPCVEMAVMDDGNTLIGKAWDNRMAVPSWRMLWKTWRKIRDLIPSAALPRSRRKWACAAHRPAPTCLNPILPLSLTPALREARPGLLMTWPRQK